MKDGIWQVIVNLEAQKDNPTGCHILNRAVFYVSRLVSSQKERDFVNHRLLSTLLSMELTVDEKLEIIKTEYHVPVDDELRKDVSALCNLSQGIRDNTLVDVIMTMYENNFTLEQIAVATKKA